MFNLLKKLVARQRTNRKTSNRRRSSSFVPAVEALEGRSLMSVSNLFFSGNMLVVQSNNTATNVEVRTSGANLVVKDVAANKTWSYAANKVGAVEFQGGAGGDKFINFVTNLSVRGFGFGGNDYLEGFNGNDTFSGGAGNDTILGYGGNDLIFGDDGNDVLRGMDGNDELQGGNGNDQLNGGAGTDKLFGQAGDDVLIAIDNGTSDYAEGGAGRDALWVDRNGSANDNTYGANSEDKRQLVTGFANGADRTLNGDRIADPAVKSGASYRTFSGNLFSSNGPKVDDVRQGSLGDCWLLAGSAAVALDSPHAIRQNVVDFNDGTFGVALGGKFYRVDNDLPVTTATGSLAYAQLGAENSLWVPVVEKAYAHHRTGANSYASLEGGNAMDVNVAFGSTSAGQKKAVEYGSMSAFIGDMYNRWNTYQAVTIGGITNAKNAKLETSHAYTVASFVKNSAGAITHVVLRNPWGVDGGGNNDGKNDGYVTVSVADLYACVGLTMRWGRVA